MTKASKGPVGHKSTEAQVELQDLGGGQYRGVYKDRSIMLAEHDGKLETTLGQLASWAGMDRKDGSGPRELVVIAQTAIDDGLVDHSDIPDLGTAQNGKNRKPYKDWSITRKATLLLMTRCRTPRAIELTRAMADVFEKWLDRRHHAPAFDQEVIVRFMVPLIGQVVEATVKPIMATITKEFEKRDAEIVELRGELKQLSAERGNVSHEVVESIKNELRKIANLDSGLPGKDMTPVQLKVWRKSLGLATSEAKSAALMPMNRPWNMLNPIRLTELQDNLKIQMKRAEAKDAMREPLMDWAKKGRN